MVVTELAESMDQASAVDCSFVTASKKTVADQTEQMIAEVAEVVWIVRTGECCASPCCEVFVSDARLAVAACCAASVVGYIGWIENWYPDCDVVAAAYLD